MLIISGIIWIIWAIIITLANYSIYKLDIRTNQSHNAKSDFKAGLIHGYYSSALIVLCADLLINAIHVGIFISIQHL